MSKQVWVTLATNDSYALGAMVLAHSLRRVNSAYPAVVLIAPAVTENMRGRLSAVFSEVITVDVLDSHDAAHLALLARPELGVTFTKIHCWSLTQYDKCVFLDADTLVVQNCDELFEREELSAAPDVGWPDCFNSGVFVFRPSQDTFNSLLEFAKERGSFDGGDQGLLNSYFSDWAHGDIGKHLPFLYNVTSVAFYSYLPALKQYGEGLKIIHFIGNAKPWLQPFNWESRTVDAAGHLQPTLQLWWDLFLAHVHPQLDETMTGLAGTLSRLTLSAAVPQQSAFDEHTRRQGWEAGNIDYMGADSFDNIWAKISSTLAQTPGSALEAAKLEEPAPTLEVASGSGEASAEPRSEAPALASSDSPTLVTAHTMQSAEAATTTRAPVQSIAAPDPVAAPVKAAAPVTLAAPVTVSEQSPVVDPVLIPAAESAPAPEPFLELTKPGHSVKVAPVPTEQAVSVQATLVEIPPPTSTLAAAHSTLLPVPIPDVPKPEEQSLPAESPKPPLAQKAVETVSAAPFTPQSKVQAPAMDPMPDATPEKVALDSASGDSPPLVSTPTKDAVSPKSAEEKSATDEGASKTERKAPPTDKLNCRLKPSVESTPLLTPDSEFEDAATLAQKIIASELGTPHTPQVISATPPVFSSAPSLSQDTKQLSVEETELPTPPVSLAQIGILPKSEPSDDKPETSQPLDASKQTFEEQVSKSDVLPADKLETKTVKILSKASEDQKITAKPSQVKAASETTTKASSLSLISVSSDTKLAPGTFTASAEKEIVKSDPKLVVAMPANTKAVLSPVASITPSVPSVSSFATTEKPEPSPKGAEPDIAKKDTSGATKPEVPEPRKKKTVKKVKKEDSSDKGSSSSETSSATAPVPPPRKKDKKPMEKS